MNKEREMLLRLMELIDREDGYYVMQGVSRQTGSRTEFEASGALEEVFDDILQYLVDCGELDE